MTTEVLTIIGLLVGAGALFYQARAYHLSRRELVLKVQDLSDVVHRLEAEINEREILARRHEEGRIEGLHAHAYALNHASTLGDLNLETLRSISTGIDGRTLDLQDLLIALISIIRRTIDGNDARSIRLLDTAVHLCNVRIKHTKLGSAWDLERAEVTKGLPETQHHDKAESAEAHLAFVTREIARLEGKYSDRVRVLNEDLRLARREFVAAWQSYNS